MRQQYNASRGYTANGLNQYTAAGSVAPTYGPRGNMTNAGNGAIVYTSENMMSSAPGASAITYDPAMRLYQLVGSGTTRFLYDGTDLVAEYDGAGNLLRRYVHGPGTDESLVWYEGSGTTDRRWLHADERGSVIALSDGSGNAIAINAYDEWGNPQSGNLGRFGYTGQTWLADIGMWYYKARMYNARLGRFMQTDPIGYQAGMNLYAYVKNDPVNLIDPMGMACANFKAATTEQNSNNDCGIPDNIVVTGGGRGGSIGGGGRIGGGDGSIGRSGGSIVVNLSSLNKNKPSPQNNTRPCNEVQRVAEKVSDFFGDAASKATDLAVTTGTSATTAAAVGAEPAAGVLGLATAHFSAQAATYGFIALVADISSGQYVKAVLDKGFDAAAKKVAPFLPDEVRSYLAGKVGSTVEYRKCGQQ